MGTEFQPVDHPEKETAPDFSGGGDNSNVQHEPIISPPETDENRTETPVIGVQMSQPAVQTSGEPTLTNSRETIGFSDIPDAGDAPNIQEVVGGIFEAGAENDV